MDGLIHANPLAARLYAVYQPISKTSINVLAGTAIDLAYGFVLAGVFLVLYQALPGSSGFLKGLSLAVLLWFLRVAMGVAGEWVTRDIPSATLAYTLASGLLEMLVLGTFYGLTLRPRVQT